MGEDPQTPVRPRSRMESHSFQSYLNPPFLFAISKTTLAFFCDFNVTLFAHTLLTPPHFPARRVRPSTAAPELTPQLHSRLHLP